MITGNSFSLIIPAYNEEDRIETVVLKYADYFKGQEIIVVCNGCVDDTPDIVAKLCATYPHIKLLNFTQKLGKGGAIVEGFKVANQEIIGFVDSDESVEPEDLAGMFAALSEADGMIASRWLKTSRILIKQPLIRRFASRILNLIVRVLFGLGYKDTQCGAKVFKKGVIKDILPHLHTKGFEFDVELLWRLKRKGYRIIEFPITWKHSEGSTFFSLANISKMFFSLLKMRLSK